MVVTSASVTKEVLYNKSTPPVQVLEEQEKGFQTSSPGGLSSSSSPSQSLFAPDPQLVGTVSGLGAAGQDGTSGSGWHFR